MTLAEQILAEASLVRLLLDFPVEIEQISLNLTSACVLYNEPGGPDFFSYMADFEGWAVLIDQTLLDREFRFRTGSTRMDRLDDLDPPSPVVAH